MRFLYTLVMGGFLVLTELPAEQPPLYASLPVAYFGTTQSFFPILYSAIAVEAQPLADAAREPRQEIIDSLPTALPTPLAKATMAESALATYWQQTALPVTGYAMFYNPNVMQEVLDYRLARGEVSSCSECVGNVALLRAGDLNRRVWLQWSDGAIEGPFLVADVAARHHVDHLLAREWVVDVDYHTAVRRNMAGPVLVTVWASPPAGSQSGVPPFAPLYATMPAVASAATAPAMPLLTSVATATALPSLSVMPSQTVLPGEGMLPQVGFPPDTPVPTPTPLPALVPVSLTATGIIAPVASPANTPTNTPGYTPASVQMNTLTATVYATLAAPSVVTPAGFPPDTPVPTVTPLPAINTPLPAQP